jgi:hypothetical protein
VILAASHVDDGKERSAMGTCDREAETSGDPRQVDHSVATWRAAVGALTVSGLLAAAPLFAQSPPAATPAAETKPEEEAKAVNDGDDIQVIGTVGLAFTY